MSKKIFCQNRLCKKKLKYLIVLKNTQKQIFQKKKKVVNIRKLCILIFQLFELKIMEDMEKKKKKLRKKMIQILFGTCSDTCSLNFIEISEILNTLFNIDFLNNLFIEN